MINWFLYCQLSKGYIIFSALRVPCYVAEQCQDILVSVFLSIHASTGSRPNNAKAAEFEVFNGILCNCLVHLI